MAWFHRIPVDEADERAIDIVDWDGNVVTVTVRLESHHGQRVIVVCCDDERRRFRFQPRDRHIVKDLWRHAVILSNNPALKED